MDVWEKRVLGSGTGTISFFYLLIFGCTGSWLPHGLSLVAESVCSGVGAIAGAHALGRLAARGIWFPEQGSNPCPPHWQAGS